MRSGRCCRIDFWKGDFMEALNEAKHELDQLVEARADLQLQLEMATEETDSDGMIKCRRELDKNSVYQYAQRAKIMRLQKIEDERQRQAALTERDALEVELVTATEAYAKAIEEADRLRIARQEIEVKLFSIDSRIEIQREAVNEGTKQLSEHVARWKTDSLLPAAELSACEL
jgi:hypothetical protein